MWKSLQHVLSDTVVLWSALPQVLRSYFCNAATTLLPQEPRGKGGSPNKFSTNSCYWPKFHWSDSNPVCTVCKYLTKHAAGTFHPQKQASKGACADIDSPPPLAPTQLSNSSATPSCVLRVSSHFCTYCYSHSCWCEHKMSVHTNSCGAKWQQVRGALQVYYRNIPHIFQKVPFSKISTCHICKTLAK